VLKRHAVEVLGNQAPNDKRAIATLTSLLDDKESAVRGAAAWALAKLRATSAREDLARIARGKGWAARINATAALAALRDPRQTATLASLTRDRDPYVRANALLGLGWLGHRDAQAQLVRRAQQDRGPWARLNALRALVATKARSLTYGGQQLRDARALAKALSISDPDPRVRHLASQLARPAASPPVVSKTQPSWIGLYMLDGDGRPLRDKPFVLITAEGLVKAGYADTRSQAWEERLPRGRCYVELPARRPRVPTPSTGN
jgi:hypothetical protein